MSDKPPRSAGGMPPLDPGEKLDIPALLQDLELYRPRRHGWHWREPVPDQKLFKFRYKETSKGLDQQHPAAGGPLLRLHRPAARLRGDHRDRLRALRGRHPPHAHGGLARRRSHDGHPHRRPESHGRAPRGHARGRRRHRRHAQAGARHAQGARPHRGRGGPAHQLPLLREWSRRPRDGRDVRRGGRQRGAPGPAVQRPLPQHQHAPQLRGCGGGQARDGQRPHGPDRRRPQRQRHRRRGVEGHA